MPVRFEINMTAKAMYSFMLQHNYTHLTGIMSVVFGAVALLMGIRQAEGGILQSAVIFFLLFLLLVFYPPVMLWMRAKRRIQAGSVFKKPLYYELSDKGVKVIQGKREEINAWGDFQRAVSVGSALVLYMDNRRAVIFPKEQLGEQFSAVVRMISTHMPPGKVRIRQVH